eukprot:11788620-Heterocapsa_arctica.AAC.1
MPKEGSKEESDQYKRKLRSRPGPEVHKDNMVRKWEDILLKLRQELFLTTTDAGRFKQGMDDPAQDELNRQNFGRLYGLQF